MAKLENPAEASVVSRSAPVGARSAVPVQPAPFRAAPGAPVPDLRRARAGESPAEQGASEPHIYVRHDRRAPRELLEDAFDTTRNLEPPAAFDEGEPARDGEAFAHEPFSD